MKILDWQISTNFLMNIWRGWPWLALLGTIIMVIVLPIWLPVDTSDPVHSLPPSWMDVQFYFGTYQGQSLLVLVAKAAWITLYISLAALMLSLLVSLTLLYWDFMPETQIIIRPLLKGLVYFPRLLFLLVWCLAWQLNQPSRLAFSPTVYLVIGMGITGGIFVAGQTIPEVCVLEKSLFVYTAESIGVSRFVIFARHILRNCLAFPLALVKQVRDNILAIVFLSFLGLVHFQPEDLGSLVHRLYTPEAFYQGWWMLFFPCVFLSWLVLLWDRAGAHLSDILAGTHRGE